MNLKCDLPDCGEPATTDHAWGTCGQTATLCRRHSSELWDTIRVAVSRNVYPYRCGPAGTIPVGFDASPDRKMKPHTFLDRVGDDVFEKHFDYALGCEVESERQEQQLMRERGMFRYDMSHAVRTRRQPRLGDTNVGR